MLRPLRPDDAETIRELVDDIEVVRWMSRIPHPYTLDDARVFIDEIAPSEIDWAVEAEGNGLIGVGGFVVRPDGDGADVELGYWFGKPFWGRGYATEAGRLMVSHAWASGAQRIASGCFDGNARSQRVLEKLGFRIVGRSTRHNRALGVDLPHVDMSAERPAA